MNLSIIIPVFNNYKLLERLLLSIVDKELRNICLQVVVVDDGSTCNIADKLSYLLEVFALRDIDLVFLRQDNLGPGKARNIGLQYAKGDYIWFSDADDCITNECFQDFLDVLPFEILEFGYYDESLDRLFIPKRKDIHKTTEYLEFFDGRLYLWNKVFHRKVLNNQSFNTDLLSLEDFCFCINVFLKDFNIRYLNNSYYEYKLNSHSITKSIDINKMERLAKDTRVVHDFLIELKSKQSDSYRKGIVNRLLDMSIAGYIYSLYKNNYNKYYYIEAFEFYYSKNKNYFNPFNFSTYERKNMFLFVILLNVMSLSFRARKKIIG